MKKAYTKLSGAHKQTNNRTFTNNIHKLIQIINILSMKHEKLKLSNSILKGQTKDRLTHKGSLSTYKMDRNILQLKIRAKQ